MGYSGRYSRAKGRFRVPVAAWVLILIAAATAITGTVTAYLSAATDSVDNSFSEAPDPTISIAETFSGSLKENVSVDVGTPGYSVFVRAAIVVTWKDAQGNVLGRAPAVGTDYTVSCNETDWFEKDGFWYCVSPVASGTTAPLILECAPVAGRTPEGYSLSVEILAQTIQALGTTDGTDIPAAQDAWHVAVVDGKLSPG